MPTVGELRAEFTVDLRPLRRGLRDAARDLAAFKKRHEKDTRLELGLDTTAYRTAIRKAQTALRPLTRDVEEFGREAEKTQQRAERSLSSITRAIQRTRQEAAKGATFDVEGKGEFAGLNAGMAAIRASAERGAELRLDTSSARTELRGYQETLRRYARSWGQQGIRTRVTADIRRATTNLQRLEAIAENATGERRIVVEAEVRRARGRLEALGQTADSLGLKNPTMTVGLRGYLATRAQMLGLQGLADRLDGYNVRFGANIDRSLSQALPSVLGALEMQVARFQTVLTAAAAVSMPIWYSAVAAIPGVTSAAAGSVGSLAISIGKGLVGALGSAGVALGLGGAALGAYGLAVFRTMRFVTNFSRTFDMAADQVGYASKAVEEAEKRLKKAEKGTAEYRRETTALAFAKANLANEEARYNALLDVASPNMLELAKAMGRAQAGSIRLGGAIMDETAPAIVHGIEVMARFRDGFTRGATSMARSMSGVTKEILDAASSGQNLKSITAILSGVRDAGAPALRTVGNAAMLLANGLAVVVPSSLKVLNTMERLSGAAARWSASAEGQSVIGRVWADLWQRGKNLLGIGEDLTVALWGVGRALDAAGTGDKLVSMLERGASAFRQNMRAGGEWRSGITRFMNDVEPLLDAGISLGSEFARQFVRVARETVGFRKEGEKLSVLEDVFKAVEDSLKPLANFFLYEFKNIGPLIGPLVRELSLWFSVMAKSQPEMKGFIRLGTEMLHLFNRLPDQTQRNISRILAYTAALKALGGGAVLSAGAGLAGFAAQMFVVRQATKSLTDALVGKGSVAAGSAAAGASAKTATGRFAGLAGKAGIGALAAPLALGGPVLLGLAALAAGLGLAYVKSDKFRAKVNGVASDLASWGKDKFRQANAAINDIFDINMGVVEKAATKAGDATVSAYSQAVKNRGGGSGEGSVGYEIGWKLAGGIGGGVKGWMEGPNLTQTLKFSFKEAGGKPELSNAFLDAFVKSLGQSARDINWSNFLFGKREDWSFKPGQGGIAALVRLIIKDTKERILGSPKNWGQALFGKKSDWTWKPGQSGIAALVRLIVKDTKERILGSPKNWGQALFGKKEDWKFEFGSSPLGGVVKGLVDDAKKKILNNPTNWGQALFGKKEDWKFEPGKSPIGRLVSGVKKYLGDKIGNTNWKDMWRKVGEMPSFKWQGSPLQRLYAHVTGGAEKTKEKTGSENRKLETNLKNTWGRIWDFAKPKWLDIAQAIIGGSQKGKEEGGRRNRDLESNLKNIWDRIWDAAKPKWLDIAQAIISGSEKGKSQGGQKQRDLESNTKNIWDRILSNSKPVWADIASHIIRKSWDTERGSTNAWSSLSNFVSEVMNRLGISTGVDRTNGSGSPHESSGPSGTGGSGSPMRGAKGGVYHGSGHTEGLTPMHSGGILEQAPVGGVADGRTPRVVYGEVGKAESYAVHGRRDNLPYAQAYADSIDMAVVPKKYVVPGATLGVDPEQAAYMATGGVLRAWKKMGVPFAAKGRIITEGAGEGQYGATNVSLWDKATVERANAIIEKFPVGVTTYENHPPGYPHLAQSSIDAWDMAGRGSPIGYPEPHNAVKSFMSSLTKGLKWILGEGSDAGHSGPNRHVHGSWEPNGAVGSGGLSGNSGMSSGPSWQQMLYDKLWPPIEKWAKSKFDPMAAQAFWAPKAGGTLGQNTIERIGDWIYEQLPKGSGSGTGSGPYQGGGNLDEWARNGLILGNAFPATASNISKIKSRAMQESGGDPNAVNDWDSNAAAGTPSKGLMQVIEPTWNANTTGGIGQFDQNWSDPVKSVGVASRYMKSNYGYVVGATGSGYARGGVTGDAPKLDMPSPVKNAFIKVADTLASMAGYGPRGAGAIKIGDKGGVGTGKHLVGITNEAGPESIIPLKKRTPEGMAAYRAATPLYGPSRSGARGHRKGAFKGVPHFAAGGIATNDWNLSGGDGYLGIGGPAARDAIAGANAWGGNAGPGSDVYAYYNKAASSGGLTTSSGKMWVAASRAGTPLGQTLWTHETGHAWGLGHGTGVMASTVNAGMQPTAAQMRFVAQQSGGAGVRPHDDGESGTGSPSYSPTSGSGQGPSAGPQVQSQSISMSSGGSSGRIPSGMIGRRGVTAGDASVGRGGVRAGDVEAHKLAKMNLDRLERIERALRDIPGGILESGLKNQERGRKTGRAIGKGQGRRARRLAAQGSPL